MDQKPRNVGGRPRKDGTPAQRRVVAETEERFEPFEIPQPKLVGNPGKTINVSLLKLSGHWLHADREAAAFQNMSPSTFSRLMTKRDPDSGLTYRDIFTNARGSGRATLLRRCMEYIDLKNGPGAAILKFVMQNEFGWSEKTQAENRGSVRHQHQHHHTHDTPKDLSQMSDAELAEYAMGVPEKGRLN